MVTDEPTRPAEATPERIASYRLGRIIGQGGWGVVYEATNTRNDERVALKLLHAHLANDESYVERFQREAQVATLLRSPYTVPIFEFGSDQGQYFLVMKFIDGDVLSSLLRQNPLQPDRALQIASQIGFALEEAEARGVIHRDIKPDNVMLDASGTVQVLDFGIARQTGRPKLTSTGAFVGTVAYAAPEVFEGRVDHRSDLYSLGVTLFHMLTGKLPFVGEALELMRQHQASPMPHGPLAGLDGDIVEAVAKLMEKDPDARYQTASEAAGVLEHLAAQAAARGDAALHLEPTDALEPGGDLTPPLTMVIAPRGRSRRFVPRGALANYELLLRNETDQAISINLGSSDPTDSCHIVVPDAVAVPARAQSTVTISVSPRFRRWTGRTETRPFSVAASIDDGSPPAVVVGEFRDQPQGLVPLSGALFSVGVLVILAIFGGLFGDDSAVDSAPDAATSPAAAATAAPATTATPVPTVAPAVSPQSVPTTVTPAPTSPPPVQSVGAVVTDDEVRFLFSLETSQTFRWNLPTSRDDALELRWTVQLPLQGKNYEFSLGKFKQPGAEQQGDFAAFLNVADLTVWERQESGPGQKVSASGLSASIVPSGVELVLGDPAFVRLLRTERPASLTFVADGSAQIRREFTRSIQYDDSGPLGAQTP